MPKKLKAPRENYRNYEHCSQGALVSPGLEHGWFLSTAVWEDTLQDHRALFQSGFNLLSEGLL